MIDLYEFLTPVFLPHFTVHLTHVFKPKCLLSHNTKIPFCINYENTGLN